MYMSFMINIAVPSKQYNAYYYVTFEEALFQLAVLGGTQSHAT